MDALFAKAGTAAHDLLAGLNWENMSVTEALRVKDLKHNAYATMATVEKWKRNTGSLIEQLRGENALHGRHRPRRGF